MGEELCLWGYLPIALILAEMKCRRCHRTGKGHTVDAGELCIHCGALLLTTAALVAEQPEDAPAMAGGGHGHDGGGMDF